MRGSRVRHVLFLTSVCIVLGACASKPHYSIDNQPAAQAGDDSASAGKRHHRHKKGRSAAEDQATESSPHDDDVGSMRSSTDQDNNWGDAVTAPLEDLNLKRQAIPSILQSAITKPYDLTGLDTCEAIAGEVAQLDALLGADFDEPPPPPGSDESLGDRSQRMANHAAVGAVRGAARSIIPFRGIVRKMTGAERHEKEVDTAIQAGKVRRAYLKGVGMNKNCAPPAAPSWFKPIPQPQPLPLPQTRKPNRKYR